MVITIMNKNEKFGARAGAQIYNHDMTKILLQRQGKHELYVFPGGRIDMHEDSQTSIERELEEELGLKAKPQLKFISEHFIKYPSLQYHEIGFYYAITINEKETEYNDYEKEYHSKDEEHDGKSIFKWFDVEKIEDVNIIPKHLKEKVKTLKLDSTYEHIVYREY